MNRARFFKILFFCFPMIAFAQGPGSAAVPFLLISPSPTVGGSVGGNAVLPIDDTFGFFYNPAQLGNFSKEYNFSTQFYPEKIDWFPEYNWLDLTFDSYAFNAGTILKSVFNDLDVNLGIGYMHTVLNLGEFFEVNTSGDVIGKFNAGENYDAFSIGLGFKYFADFSLGYTYKKINSKLGAPIQVGSETNAGKAETSAYDLGFMISYSFFDDAESALLIDDNLRFYSDIHFGLAMSNMGDRISYGSKQSDPLPRELRMGLGVSAGIRQKLNNTSLKAVEVQLVREADNAMLKKDDKTSLIVYQDFPGDINLYDHLLAGNGDAEVTVHTTVRFSLAESFYLGFHKYKGYGWPEYVYNFSHAFSTKGIFKLLADNHPNTVFVLLNCYFEIRYTEDEINVPRDNPLHGTRYKSIALYFKNLEL